MKCDCGSQLKLSMQKIQEEGTGAILYLRQEGRGIGLHSKIQAYALQDKGHDTLDANLLLGLPADGRDYSIAADMLKEVGVSKVRYSSICCFTVTAVANHSSPLETHSG